MHHRPLLANRQTRPHREHKTGGLDDEGPRREQVWDFGAAERCFQFSDTTPRGEGGEVVCEEGCEDGHARAEGDVDDLRRRRVQDSGFGGTWIVLIGEEG
jgi:hypothetical protein